MNKGTIILAPFPFTDLTGNKLRPALIISTTAKRGNDVIISFISSRVESYTRELDFVLDISHPDFKASGLKVSSVFKMDKFVTIEKRLIVGELGKLSDSIIAELNKRLRLVFGI